MPCIGDTKISKAQGPHVVVEPKKQPIMIQCGKGSGGNVQASC